MRKKIAPILIQTQPPSAKVNDGGELSYREIYNVINSSVFAVLISGVLVAWYLQRVSRRVIKHVMELPWFAKVPHVVNLIYEDIPELSDHVRDIEVKILEVMASLDSLEKRSITTEVQIDHLRAQLSELINLLRSKP